MLSVLYYEDEEEGVAIANDTKYGLASAMFGPEESQGGREKIRAGNATINDGKSPAMRLSADTSIPAMAGGGKYGLLEFLQTKAIFRQE